MSFLFSRCIQDAYPWFGDASSGKDESEGGRLEIKRMSIETVCFEHVKDRDRKRRRMYGWRVGSVEREYRIREGKKEGKRDRTNQPYRQI